MSLSNLFRFNEIGLNKYGSLKWPRNDNFKLMFLSIHTALYFSFKQANSIVMLYPVHKYNTQEQVKSTNMGLTHL